MGSSEHVAVTGAGGFIGQHIVRQFLRYGWKVTALVHRRIPQWYEATPGLEVCRLDVTRPEEVRAWWNARAVKPRVIVHAAGLASDVGPDALFRRLNLESVQILAGLGAERFIFISSTDVYGIRDFAGETEGQLGFDPAPTNPYPKYKILAERWLAGNLAPSRHFIIRPAAVWGEGDVTLEPRAVDFLRNSPCIVHFGAWKGQNRWPLASAETVGRLAVAAARTRDFDGEAVNAIDPGITTLDAWYRQLAARHFPDKQFRQLNLPLAAGLALGWTSSALSRALGRTRPLFDPTRYALRHITSNLDFSCARQQRMLGTLPDA